MTAARGRDFANLPKHGPWGALRDGLTRFRHQYVLATGCQWRALPRDFPPYSTVINYFYSKVTVFSTA